MDAARGYEREAIQSNPTVNKIDDPRLGWLINADFFHHTCHGPPVSEACRIWRASDHLAMTVAAQVNLTMEHFSAHFFVHTKEGSTAMEIRAGYEISYACAQPTLAGTVGSVRIRSGVISAVFRERGAHSA